MNKQEMGGVLILNKHEGPTSHDIVNAVRKLYGTKQVGHTGTLDPMATGVLVVLVGRAAKAAEYLVSDSKKYRATLRLGLVTDTQDVTGEILKSYDGTLPTPEQVKTACVKLVGRSEQLPPMYSAIKVGGKKLVDLARQGVEIERKARPIEIFSIGCEPVNESDYTLDIHCSSGTYVRTICNDIGEMLGCGGVMATLCRTETGGFPIEESITIDELKNLDEKEREELLVPIESLFSSLPSVNLPAFYEKLCRSGCEIYQKKLKAEFDIGTRVRICSESGEFFALGEVFEYENGSAIKAIKTFKL